MSNENAVIQLLTLSATILGEEEFSRILNDAFSDIMETECTPIASSNEIIHESSVEEKEQ